ncbi:hypothetical protein EJB05_27938 [Eragrostis curvula]|uniref:Uncharacterized protein n=1 Tax=Eragrostis curvula TaxID=38414 RepID=A0A5J9UNW2_9POAL|nr:hypothetical protein EJB05_27938 [Eragrostis curvula]
MHQCSSRDAKRRLHDRLEKDPLIFWCTIHPMKNWNVSRSLVGLEQEDEEATSNVSIASCCVDQGRGLSDSGSQNKSMGARSSLARVLNQTNYAVIWQKAGALNIKKT